MSSIVEATPIQEQTIPRRIASEATATGKEPLSPQGYFLFKGWADRLIATLLLIPFLPLIGLLIILIRCTSRGPAVFQQRRVGRNGRIYTMHKLRSMHCNAEAGTGPTWTKGCCDPRITPLGRWLRKLHLDELPQLFNVLRGEMSLVGPRPERPEFVEVLKEAIPGYERRLTVRPGITGLAQINLPPDTDLDSVRRKQMLDLEYTKAANSWLDLRILFATALRIVGTPGSIAAWAARVERKVELPNLEDTVDMAAALSDTTTLTTLVDQLRSETPETDKPIHANGHPTGSPPLPYRTAPRPSELTKRHPK